MPFIDKKKFSSDSNGKYSDFFDLGAFKAGLVNRVNSYDLPKGALLDAINVDIDNSGKIKRRKGYEKLITGKCHSVYGDSKGNGYLVKDGSLLRFNTIDNSTKLIANGFTDNNFISYVEVNHELYYSDGQSITGKINSSGNHEIWSIRSPQTQPMVTNSGNGSLKAGTYLIAYTYLYGSYETGVSPHVQIDIPTDGGGIFVVCGSSSDSTGANIYITALNSQVLQKVATGYTANITSDDNLGKQIKKLSADGIPAMSNLSYNNGRIWGSYANYIYWTLEMDYRQFNPVRNGVAVDSNVVIFAAMQSGCWVVTETTTYWLKGTDPDSNDLELNPIFPYGAIPGTLFNDEDKQVVGWLSSAGYIQGDAFGKIQNLTAETIDFPKNYKSGAALFKKSRGIKQVVFSLQQTGTDTTFETEEYKLRKDRI